MGDVNGSVEKRRAQHEYCLDNSDDITERNNNGKDCLIYVWDIR